MTDHQNRLEMIVNKLRHMQFRITPQRLAILKAFLTSETHPTVEEIFQQVKIAFPTTSLATVYKTVHLLKEIGEILEIDFSDNSNRYDGKRPYPHPHIICRQCGAIMDPKIDSLDKMIEEMESKSGYMISSHQINFFGVCPSCRSKK
nr:Fur family transcriptional regulator [uncultured Desulfuromonas sp.]